jgi:hypothetical protein|tara:strand:- start:347 stop:463 length:117 start_codon:yes stop_codon:yes gene_type:complete
MSTLSDQIAAKAAKKPKKKAAKRDENGRYVKTTTPGEE